MKTAQAGTLESMDCIVTVTEAEKGRGISVSIQDNGAIDLVLKARVEAAVRRLAGGNAA
jgi:citrate lyase subunit gamma (acyl carrier protein)